MAESDAASKTIGRQLRAAREMLRPRVSQAELARRLAELGVDMHQTTISRLETGEQRITVDDFFAITAALGVKPLHILSGDFTNEDVPVTRDLAVPPSRMRDWIRGDLALPRATDEAAFFEHIPDEERLERQWRGLEHMRQSFRDFLEAYRRPSGPDHGAMKDALDDLRREIERQQEEIAREQARAKRARKEK